MMEAISGGFGETAPHEDMLLSLVPLARLHRSVRRPRVVLGVAHINNCS